MQKRTKILLGVGALAIAGYFIWKNNQPKDIFANASGKSLNPTLATLERSPGCPCHATASDQGGVPNGWELCKGVGSDGLPDKICRKVKATQLETA